MIARRLFPAIILILFSTSACLPARPATPPSASPWPPAQPQVQPPAPSGQATSSRPVPVPAEFQDIYKELTGKLDAFDSRISGEKTGTPRSVILAAELLTANSNIGEGLFSETNFQANRVYLDALQAINVTGVQVTISYPQLTPDFPNAARYLTFYKKVMQELRARGMKVLVKVGNPFANSVYSDLRISFDGLTLENYRAGKKAMAHLIARELKPDYLTVCNEPNTEKMTMGLLQSPQQYAGTVRYILDGLDRGDILIGGGAGTWDDLAYMRELAGTSLDYLDAHVYPLDYLDRFINIAAIAKAGNKRFLIGEAWAYKLSGSELWGLGDIAATSRIYGRDMFSFWEPLDSRFLSVLVKMSRIYGYEFISPFWSTYFYGYLDYDSDTKGLEYRKLRQESNRISYQNMLQKQPSGSGITYRQLGQQP